MKVPITVAEAGLGAKIEVPTIDGRTLLKIPPGTQNDQKFRLRERASSIPARTRAATRSCEVSLKAPVLRDERTRELLRELAELHPEDPRAEMWAKV